MANPRHDPMRGLLGELADGLQGDRWQPPLDVFETESAIVVRVELAGVRREDLQVAVDRDVLRIRGVRRAPPEGEVERLHGIEISFGPFERSVAIPVPFEADRVAAHLADGFLRVTLPKRVRVKRSIEVERS